MSDHREVVYSTSEGIRRTNGSFKTFVRIGTIATGVIATIGILMAIFLTGLSNHARSN